MPIESDWLRASRIMQNSISGRRMPNPLEFEFLKKLNAADKERYRQVHEEAKEIVEKEKGLRS